MRAGKLRERVTLQSSSVARDSFGGETLTWNDQRTVWASVEPLRGREYLEARATTQTVTHRIRIRYPVGLTVVPSWRVSYDGRTFDIESVINEMERDRHMILMCKENV